MAKLQTGAAAQSSIQTSPVSHQEKTVTIPLDTRSTRLHTCAVAFDSAIRYPIP